MSNVVVVGTPTKMCVRQQRTTIRAIVIVSTKIDGGIGFGGSRELSYHSENFHPRQISSMNLNEN